MEGLEDVRKLTVSKGDVIVVRVKEVVSNETCQRITEMVGKLFPDNECIVLGHGMSIDVFTPHNGE